MRPVLLLIAATLSACHKPYPTAGPTIEVRLDAPDLTSGEMEGVATTLERACSHAAHVAHLHGVSRDGATRITVEFEAGTNGETAFFDVQKNVRGARPFLPLNAGPVVVVRGAGRVAARITWWSSLLPMVIVDHARQAAWAGPLSQVPGVDTITACGGADERVMVDIDALALAGAGIMVGDVATVLSKAHADVGNLPLVVLGTSHGAPVRLRDVAKVVDDASLRPCRAYDERGPVTEDVVRATNGADPAAVAKAIDAKRSLAARAVPPAVDLRPLRVSRDIAVDLDPAVNPRAYGTLADAVAGVAGAGHFLVEVGSVDDPEDAPTTAHVLLDTKDDAVTKSVIKALAQVPFVRGCGEPNATVELLGPDRAALKIAGQDLFRLLSQRGELVSRLGTAERAAETAHVDKETAAKLGLSLNDVMFAIGAQHGRVVATTGTDGQGGAIVVRIKGRPTELYVRSPGGPIPLSAVTSWSIEPSPPTLLNEDMLPMIGARVHATDVAALQHVFQPPAGITLRVVAD